MKRFWRLTLVVSLLLLPARARATDAEVDRLRAEVQALLARIRGSQQVIESGRVGGAGAHCVHADAAIL